MQEEPSPGCLVLLLRGIGWIEAVQASQSWWSFSTPVSSFVIITVINLYVCRAVFMEVRGQFESFYFLFFPPGSWQLNSGYQVLMPLPSDLTSSGGCVLNLKIKCVFWWIPCRMWETGSSQGFCIWGGGINTGVKCFTNVITWKYFHECFPDSISGMETGSERKGMWPVKWTLAGWRFHLKYKD